MSIISESFMCKVLSCMCSTGFEGPLLLPKHAKRGELFLQAYTSIHLMRFLFPCLVQVIVLLFVIVVF